MLIAESFKKTRIRHELTQVQLAKALGISDKMVSQIENGFRPPSAEILRKRQSSWVVPLMKSLA